MYLEIIPDPTKVNLEFIRNFFKLVGVKFKEKPTTVELNGVQDFDVTAFIHDFYFDSLNFKYVDYKQLFNQWHKDYMNRKTDLQYAEYCKEHTNHYTHEFITWSEKSLRSCAELLKKVRSIIDANGWNDYFFSIDTGAYEGEDFEVEQWQNYNEIVNS